MGNRLRLHTGMRLKAAFLALALLALGARPGMADIYRYVDENGVTHYTNVPTRGAYTLYMREASLDRHSNASSVRTGTSDTRLYDRHILEASNRHQVDFNLIKAVIKVESSFNPEAVSRKGARGLMQIMPDNFVRLGISDPENPRQNIMGGARYLRQMLNRFEGKTSLALAAYNAGPGAVEKYRSIPPFDETQDYVQRVMAEYKRLRNIRRSASSQWRVRK